MKLITVLILFLSISASSRANDLDSLKEVIHTTKGGDLIQTAILIGKENYKRTVYDSATSFYKVGLEEAERVQDYLSAGKICNNLGVIEYRKGSSAKAILNYQETLKYYRKTNNDTLVGNALINLGMAYKKLVIYDKALTMLQDGVRILERLNEEENLAKGLNALANIYKKTNDFDRAFEYHGMSLKLKQKRKDLKGIAVSLQNLGLVHSKLGQLDSALIYFQRSLEIKRKVPNAKKLIPSTLSQLGEMYLNFQDYTKSELFLKESLELRMENEDANGVAVIANQLANSYLVQDRLSEAFKYL